MANLLYRAGVALGVTGAAAVGSSLAQGWRPDSISQATIDASKFAQGSGVAVSRATQDVVSGSRIVFGARRFEFGSP